MDQTLDAAAVTLQVDGVVLNGTPIWLVNGQKAEAVTVKPGDTIELTTPIGGCVYQVSKAPYPVSPTDLTVIDPTGERSLTLTTCHPKGSAAQRLIVRATWVKDLKAA